MSGLDFVICCFIIIIIIFNSFQHKDKNLPWCDSYFLPYWVPQCGPNGKGTTKYIKSKTKQNSIHLQFNKEAKTTFVHLQLVCEEINVDRFYPVLYPKVSPSRKIKMFSQMLPVWLAGCYLDVIWQNHVLQIIKNSADSIFWYSHQASRLIVTFDEHVISNNFKFGVIYQKFGQVSEFPMTSLLRHLKSGFNHPEHVSFLLLSSCRQQKKSSLETWKKVLLLLSSWNFWVTGLSFMTLKGSVTLQLSFSFFLNLYYGTPSYIHQMYSMGTLLLIRVSFNWVPVKKKKTLECPDICGGMVRVIDWTDKMPLSLHKDGWG